MFKVTNSYVECKCIAFNKEYIVHNTILIT